MRVTEEKARRLWFDELQLKEKLAPQYTACFDNSTAGIMCLCHALGTQRCTKGIMRAYLDKDTEVLGAIRFKLRENATSTAVHMCEVLGPEKCAEPFAQAVRNRHADVVEVRA